MGFSLVAEGLLRSYLPETDWRPLITKPGYSFGFLVVVIGRQQLYTENTREHVPAGQVSKPALGSFTFKGSHL